MRVSCRRGLSHTCHQVWTSWSLAVCKHRVAGLLTHSIPQPCCFPLSQMGTIRSGEVVCLAQRHLARDCRSQGVDPCWTPASWAPGRSSFLLATTPEAPPAPLSIPRPTLSPLRSMRGDAHHPLLRAWRIPQAVPLRGQILACPCSLWPCRCMQLGAEEGRGRKQSSAQPATGLCRECQPHVIRPGQQGRQPPCLLGLS